jgi:hypothetical protein
MTFFQRLDTLNGENFGCPNVALEETHLHQSTAIEAG